jgi:hypothetical protein
MQIEIVAVVSSSAVAIAGIVVPSWGKGGDRKHEQRMLHERKLAESRAAWWEHREVVYLDSLKVAVQFRKLLELLEYNAIGPKDVAAAVPSEVSSLTARMDAYGSRAASDQMQEVVGPLLRFIEDYLAPNRTPDRLPQDVLAETRARYPALAKTIRDELATGPSPV